MELLLTVLVRSLAMGLTAAYAFIVIRRWRRAGRHRLARRMLQRAREQPLRHGEVTTLAGKLTGGPARSLAVATGTDARISHHQLRHGTSRPVGPLTLALPDGESVVLSPPLVVLEGTTELWRGDILDAGERTVWHEAKRLEPSLARQTVLAALCFGDPVLASGYLSHCPEETGYRQSARRWTLSGGARQDSSELILTAHRSGGRPFPLRTMAFVSLFVTLAALAGLLPLHLLPGSRPEPTWQRVGPQEQVSLSPQDLAYLRFISHRHGKPAPSVPGVHFVDGPHRFGEPTAEPAPSWPRPDPW